MQLAGIAKAGRDFNTHVGDDGSTERRKEGGSEAKDEEVVAGV